MKEIKTIAAWIKQAGKTGAGNAGKFLEDTRGFLLSAELKEITTPIFGKLDAKETFPTPAIQALYKVLGAKQANDLLTKAYQQGEREESKCWIATVYEPDNSPIANNQAKVIARQSFESEYDARGWANRFLTNHSASDHYATIQGKKEKTCYNLTRDEAMYMVIKGTWKPAAATVKQVRVSATRLSLGVGQQRNKPTYFSRG